MSLDLRTLQSQFPRQGRVEWIGVRQARKADVKPLESVECVPGRGLIGDHRAEREPRPGGSGKREVTLIQAEHFPIIEALSDWTEIKPERLRRNIVISGINLLALRHCRFQIGAVVMQMTGTADPCSRMEAALGPGGFNAMRGHGGMTAKILEPGEIRLGDTLSYLDGPQR